MFQSLRVQIFALTLVPALIIGIAGLFVEIFSLRAISLEVGAVVEESVMSVEKRRIRNVIDSAMGAIEQQLQQPGMTGRQEGLSVLSKVSFDGGTGYIFGYDSKGTRLLQGDTDTGLGDNFWELKDQQGTQLIKGLYEASTSGDGYFTYYFPKPGEEEASPKYSYSRWIPQWDMFIGTGLYIDSTEAVLANIDQNFSSVLTRAISSSAILVVVLLGGVVAIASWVIGLLYRPLLQLKASMNELAHGEGDLTRQLPNSYTTIVNQISESFNLFMSSLNSDIKELQISAEELSVLASEATQKSNKIDSDLHKQEEETMMVASAIDEMSSAANQIADSASVSQTSAEEADQQVSSTSKIVDASVKSMQNLDAKLTTAEKSVDELGHQVQAINEFLTVIQGISEQTNLLALNAAIEAARAGEQGRGFAVVADEVRSLAQKSAQSTEEISQILDQLGKSSQLSLNGMTEAREQRESVVQSMNEIQQKMLSTLDIIRELTDQNVQVASSATEQSSVSDEIQQRVNGVKMLSESIRQESNDGRAVFEKLSQYATQLKDISGKFKVS